MTASGITGSTGLIGREIIKNKLGKFKKFTGDLKKMMCTNGLKKINLILFSFG